MSKHSSIEFHMKDYQASVTSIRTQKDLIYDTLHDILADFNYANKALEQSANECTNERKAELNEVSAKAKDSILKECESLKGIYRELTHVLADCANFQRVEKEAREQLQQNPEEFDEKHVKKLFTLQATEPPADDECLVKMTQMTENVRNGIDELGEDLVMDEPHNQIVKCPITGKEINNACKNTKCDHVYEREAILGYVKGRVNRKCPYAGCPAIVALAK